MIIVFTTDGIYFISDTNCSKRDLQNMAEK